MAGTTAGTRVGIIGMGWVGSSVAISTLHAGVARELLLNDLRVEVAEGEAMDLAQGTTFYPPASVRVASVHGAQLAGVPKLKNPDQVTRLEEERIVAYFGGGTLYADARRAEPLL